MTQRKSLNTLFGIFIGSSNFHFILFQDCQNAVVYVLFIEVDRANGDKAIGVYAVEVYHRCCDI